jgi:hypothetical protein
VHVPGFGLKQRIRDTRLYDLVLDVRQRREVREWERSGKSGLLPHARKQEIVRAYGKSFGLRVLVETGTYLGLMVRAMRRHFDELHSIELDDALFRRAARRFARFPNVHLLHGDSGKLLPRVLERIESPALFWLDAHWSGGITARGDTDTPIMRELEAVLSHGHGDRHVVLIDDARHFTGDDYPTVAAVRARVEQLRPGMVLEVADDIIRITPAQ